MRSGPRNQWKPTKYWRWTIIRNNNANTIEIWRPGLGQSSENIKHGTAVNFRGTLDANIEWQIIEHRSSNPPKSIRKRCPCRYQSFHGRTKMCYRIWTLACVHSELAINKTSTQNKTMQHLKIIDMQKNANFIEIWCPRPWKDAKRVNVMPKSTIVTELKISYKCLFKAFLLFLFWKIKHRSKTDDLIQN